jgi:tetratricopeptide (TPR) repeat protein
MTRTLGLALAILALIAASSCSKSDPPASASSPATPSAPSAPSAPAANAEAVGAYLDGLDALAAGRYADAEKSFAKAIAADEENASYYQARGVARALAQNLDGAISDLQRAQRLGDAANWETKAWIGVVSKMNGHPESGFSPGLAPRTSADYGLALSDMSQNYWSSTNNHNYYDKSARKMVETTGAFTGDFPRVAEFYVGQHRTAGGGDAKIALGRVQAKLTAGQPLDALQTVRPLLAANPGDPDLLSAEAQALLALGDVADARAVFTDALTRRQTAADYIGRARAAAVQGDSARVAKDVAEAAKLDPSASREGKGIQAAATGPADPKLLRAELEIKARADVAADDLAKSALALLRSEGAVRLRYDERYQDRLAVLEAALRAKPDDPDRQVAVARFLREESDVLTEQVGPRAEPVKYRVQSEADLAHDIDRAWKLVEAALKGHPKHVGALAMKAQMLIAENRYDEAQAVVAQALAIKADDPNLLEALAGLLRIQAARRISEAGNLKQIKSWSYTDFNLDPPIEYTWWRLPNKQELAQAAALEQQASQISKLAEQQLEKAAKNAGQTAEGFYYLAVLHRARGDEAAAKVELTKAVAMKPDFEKAWYDLSAVCTHLMDSPGAMHARAMAVNLSQTTAAAELKALWYDIPHTKFKTAREAVAAGLQRDPADPRLPAYLAVIDEATEKSDDALTHYRMAKALSDAVLAWHGTPFAPPAAGSLGPWAEDAGFAAAVRLRIGAILLDQGKADEAAREFAAVVAVMDAMPEAAAKMSLDTAMLPPTEPASGTVPLPESVATLRIRAAAGEAYARWAAAGKNAQESALAAKTYRRMMITYDFRGEKPESLKAIADLGMAELYLHRGQFAEASVAMKDTPAVPQDFWQEMRRTESDIRAKGK